MMPNGGVMPGPGPMRAPNPMMNLQRAAVLRGGPPAPMPAPGGAAQAPMGGLPGMGGFGGNQPMPAQAPVMPRPPMGPGPMQAPQMPRQPLPGPMGGPAQNLWAGPQGY